MEWFLKEFNELTIDELYDLLKLRQDVFILEQQCVYPELDNFDQSAIHLYLKIEDELAAVVRIFRSGVKFEEASIGRVLVAKKFRGHGYGRKIMDMAINYLEEKFAVKKIKIQAQEYLHVFYGSLGFRQISQPYLDDGILHIDMLRGE